MLLFNACFNTIFSLVIIFDSRLSLPAAKSLCISHGGYLFTPRNEQENAKLVKEIETFEPQCAGSDGNVFWMGASTSDFKLLLKDHKQNQVIGNFSDWKAPLYEANNECVYMRKDGKWLSYNGCGFLELCPVCGFVGTPVLTLKGT